MTYNPPTSYTLTVHLQPADKPRIESTMFDADSKTEKFVSIRVGDLSIFVHDADQAAEIRDAAADAVQMIKGELDNR